MTTTTSPNPPPVDGSLSDHDILIRLSEQVDHLRKELEQTYKHASKERAEIKCVLSKCRGEMEPRMKTLELDKASREGSWKAVTGLSAMVSGVVACFVNLIVLLGLGS